MAQNAPLPVWVRLMMIVAVARSNTKHVPTKLTFYFSKFHKFRCENLNFDAKMAQKVAFPVWVRLMMIGAVVGRTTEHVSIKLTFYF